MNDTPINTTAPPGQGEPRERTLTDGTKEKWCSLGTEWGTHYRAGHPTGNVAIDVVEGAKSNEVIETPPMGTEVIDTPPTGIEVDSEAVACLRKSGLLS